MRSSNGEWRVKSSNAGARTRNAMDLRPHRVHEGALQLVAQRARGVEAHSQLPRRLLRRKELRGQLRVLALQQPPRRWSRC